VHAADLQVFATLGLRQPDELQLELTDAALGVLERPGLDRLRVVRKLHSFSAAMALIDMAAVA
jgi:hypothetical protein